MTGPKTSFWMISSSCAQPVDDAGCEEVAPLADPVAAGQHPGVVGQPGDEPGDPVQLVGVVQRPEVGVRVVRTCCHLRFSLLGERRGEVVVDARARQHPGCGGAVLAGVEVAGDRDRLGCLRRVGVVEDDDRRLAAELQVHSLEVGGRCLCHLHASADASR